MTSDLKAAHHVLFNNNDYLKLKVNKYMIGQLFGKGPFCGTISSWGLLDNVTILYRNSNC